jgi:DNA invertase Pin-like site-specific DNA recombinase
MEAQLPLARRTELAWRRTQPTAPRQDLVLDDVRLRAMTPAERLAALRAIALLLLEAVGVAMREAGDDKMTTHDALIPTVVLQRKAVVYVRQSTPQQVQSNLESQRRQYELVEVARRRGFTSIEVIDEDLGRTASGVVERPGFDRLVAALCAGQVGAVLCLDASRLARNGRDWHHLLELCGLVEARVIDLDGVYDPCRPNDRLLLGMKGSISEFELGIIRSRMYDAARSKAKRGELRISSPIGYAWDRYVGLGLDPDARLQEVIRLVFQKFRELGSARQVLLWMASQNIHFPYPSNGRTLTSFEWRPIRYRNVISILKNPFYAGVYAYGKSEKRTTIVDGRARKSYGHRKPIGMWEVFIKDHHEGYISWAEFERNQALLAGMVIDMRHERTRRLNQSSTTARWTKPRAIGM